MSFKGDQINDIEGKNEEIEHGQVESGEITTNDSKDLKRD